MNIERIQYWLAVAATHPTNSKDEEIEIHTLMEKLEGCVVVNSESLLFHAQSIRMFNNGDWENVCQEIEEHVCAIETMLEAARGGNE